ncbi:uncharacterized protein [Notothenia coriiceps]|uniref:Uncharacterized protein n=1 Tax=Notothenia coriiceps TaxID=8208 RepID=A0A6I9N0E5_9TELE|nr:PREDICTED: uncharacterized protein LOC104943658 [Notothenia coriiceps]
MTKLVRGECQRQADMELKETTRGGKRSQEVVNLGSSAARERKHLMAPPLKRRMKREVKRHLMMMPLVLIVTMRASPRPLTALHLQDLHLHLPLKMRMKRKERGLRAKGQTPWMIRPWTAQVKNMAGKIMQVLFQRQKSKQVKPGTASQIQKQHPASVLHRPRTHGLRPLLFLCPLSRNAGRLSLSPQARTTAKCSCRLHPYLHLPPNCQVNLPFSPLGGTQTLPSPLLHHPHLVPLRASNCFPLPPNQVKAMPSLCPRLYTKIWMNPKRDPLLLLRPPLSNPLGNGVQEKIPPNLPSLLVWCAALCRTCHWTTPLCAGWPSRRPLRTIPATNGPEAGLGPPACLRPPVTPSERKTRMRKKVNRG